MTAEHINIFTFTEIFILAPANENAPILNNIPNVLVSLYPHCKLTKSNLVVFFEGAERESQEVAHPVE